MPHRSVDHEGRGQPLVVTRKDRNAPSQLMPYFRGYTDLLLPQHLQRRKVGVKCFGAVLILFIEQAFALGHQQLIFCGEPTVPSETINVFADPLISALGAGMPLVTPLKELKGDVWNKGHEEMEFEWRRKREGQSREERSFMVWNSVKP